MLSTFGKRKDGKNEEIESDDPDRLAGVTREFMVCLAWAVKDAEVEEKHCYHCSSPEHSIYDCPLVKALREGAQLNCREGTASKKGGQALKQDGQYPRVPRRRSPRHKIIHADYLLSSRPIPALVWSGKCSQIKINGESCMALLGNGVQIKTIMANYVKSHSLGMGPITDLLGA